MAKDKNPGLIKLVLVAILVLLLLAIVSEVMKLIFNDTIAWFATVIVLILGIMWLLSRDGQKKLKDLLNDAGL